MCLVSPSGCRQAPFQVEEGRPISLGNLSAELWGKQKPCRFSSLVPLEVPSAPDPHS